MSKFTEHIEVGRNNYGKLAYIDFLYRTTNARDYRRVQCVFIRAVL